MRATSMGRVAGLSALLLAGTALCGAHAHAQSVSADASLPTNTVVGNAANGSGGTNYTVDGGTLAGSNLFHSFADFSLNTNDAAIWQHSGGAVTNIINRVTGGAASDINGRIDTTAMPGANFFFINPNGVVFGQSAVLDIPAAAYFSTATSLRFSDGAEFLASTVSGSTLSVAAPASFGFVGTSGDIRTGDIVRGSYTPGSLGAGFSNSDQALNFIAPNISIDGGGAFLTPRAIAFVATGSATDVSITDPLASANTGKLDLTNVSVKAEPGIHGDGSILLGGGDITITDSFLDADWNYVNGAGGLNGSNITINAAGNFTMTGSRLEADTEGDSASGKITINAGGVIGLTSSSIETYTEGAGNSGDVSVRAQSDINFDSSLIESNSFSSGNSGKLSVDSGGAITLKNASFVDSDAWDTGKSGDVSVAATGTITLSDESFIQSDAQNGSSSGSVAVTSRAGDIVIETGSFVNTYVGHHQGTQPGQVITTTTPYGSGDINVTAHGSVLLRTGGYIDDEVKEDTNVYATGGAVTVTAQTGKVSVDGTAYMLSSEALTRSRIVTFTEADGSAGAITVTANAGAIELVNGAIINASSTKADSLGQAGDITLNGAGGISLLGNSEVSASTAGQKKAGDITLRAGYFDSATGLPLKDGSGNIISPADLHFADGSFVDASTTGTGAGGAVSVTSTGNLTLDDTRSSLGSGQQPGSYITSQARRGSTGTGSAGALTITSYGNMSLANSSYFNASTASAGSGSILGKNGGAIDVWAGGTLNLTSGGRIVSLAEEGSTGDAGPHLTVTSVGAMTLDGGRIDASTLGTGSGAALISVSTTGPNATLTLLNGSVITSRSGRPPSDNLSGLRGTLGNAGDLSVSSTGNLLLDSGSLIDASTYGTGAGGAVDVSSGGTLRLAGSSRIISLAGEGSSGNAGSRTNEGSHLTVKSAGAMTLDGGTIDASTLGTGSGAGLISVSTTGPNATLTLLNGSVITSRSGRAPSASLAGVGGTLGNAGDLSVSSTGNLLLDSGSLIDASTYGTGAGGAVSVSSGGTLRLAGGSRIISLTGEGSSGNAGSQLKVTSVGAMTLDGGTIDASTLGTGAGAKLITVSTTGTNAPLTLLNGGLITSRSGRAASGTLAAVGGTLGDAGDLSVSSTGNLMLDSGSAVDASTYGTGTAGSVDVSSGGTLRLAGGSRIISLVGQGAAGSAGSKHLKVTSVGAMTLDGGTIDASTLGTGAGAQLITVSTTGPGAGLTLLNGSLVTSRSGRAASGSLPAVGGTLGNAGDLSVISAGSLLLDNGSAIDASTYGTGAGGDIRVTTAGGITLTRASRIDASAKGSGAPGIVVIDDNKNPLSVLSGSSISTDSANFTRNFVLNYRDGSASGVDLYTGDIMIVTGDVLIDGAGSMIEAQNTTPPAQTLAALTSSSPPTQTGGNITINDYGNLTILNGGQINTNSVVGDAGTITINFLPPTQTTGILRLAQGPQGPGSITTNSGSQSGGHITISNAFAIIADGSNISASGKVDEASVTLGALVRITSTDHPNVLNVNGTVAVSADQDVSSGTTIVEAPTIDSSKVLEGRCQAVRSQGRASRLYFEQFGPYASIETGVQQQKQPLALLSTRFDCL